ncbi:MAG: hypothetical protein PG981_000371 [Wolbachia endosymbiont of Ctenocephalides orientis wCori]|nr:MAG: hypothetical protein PG981_000371 [Wolbachia endosymbiont of Ctenocephalides orientis wCori]
MYDKGLSGNEEWDQLEAEWNTENGEVEELEKENEYSVMDFQQETILDLVWGEKIVEWLAEEVVLTENQHKLDQGLLIALSSINCSYLEIYNHRFSL